MKRFLEMVAVGTASAGLIVSLGRLDWNQNRSPWSLLAFSAACLALLAWRHKRSQPQTWWQRVEAELLELEERIDRLLDFIISGRSQRLSEEQQSLLADQLGAMQSYRNTLVKRLKAGGEPV